MAAPTIDERLYAPEMRATLQKVLDKIYEEVEQSKAAKSKRPSSLIPQLAEITNGFFQSESFALGSQLSVNNVLEHAKKEYGPGNFMLVYSMPADGTAYLRVLARYRIHEPKESKPEKPARMKIKKEGEVQAPALGKPAI